MTPRLLLVPSAPVIERPDGRVRLDIKFVEGMRQHRAHWPGTVHCVLRRGATAIPFGADYHPAELGFDVTIIPEGRRLGRGFIERFDIALLAGDMPDDLHASPAGASRTRIVYAIEYTLETRLRIIALDRGKGLPRRLYAALWTIFQEMRRRRAFRRADAIQANGWPAFRAYRALSRDAMMYLDNRMRADLFATPAEIAARAARLCAGAPLRLIYSGRLEALKGIQDLVPLCRKLRDRGVAFSLAIYGAGSLAGSLRAGIAEAGLGACVSLHEAVDFETELVALTRTECDLFVCCHRQADPSCTYLESMGCGLPIAGYANRMWAALQADSGGGWAVPLGRIGALADLIARLDGNRAEIVERSARARDYAAAHDFQAEFGRRLDHLASLLEVRPC